MQRNRLILCGLIAATACFSAQAESLDARLLASQCAQCHGTNGTGREHLAGKSYGELLEELIEMKRSPKRDLMHLQAKGYSDQQLSLIAAYFSGLVPASASGDEHSRDRNKHNGDREDNDD
jgi:cytochrome c553